MRVRSAALAIALGMTLAAPAHAGTVTTEYVDYGDGCLPMPWWIDFAAGPGETNRLYVAGARDGTLSNVLPHEGPSCLGPDWTLSDSVITDGSTDLVAGAGCRQLRPRTAHCGGLPLHATLGDGDDFARLVNRIADTIACGPGVDSVVADPSDTVAADCESVTRLLA